MAAWLISLLTLFVEICLSQSQVLFNGDAVLVVSNEDRFNNTAFNMTYKDFIIDFYNAFGIAPMLQDTTYTPCSASFTGIDTISVIYLGLFENNPYPISLLPNKNINSCVNGTESHCIMVVYDTKYNVYSLIAMGNDTRGAIYAAYSISELIFNVDPLYRFSGINGIYYPNGITLNKTLTYTFPPPLFQYRALFNNDEDLLGDAFADPYGEAVHSGTVYNWLFESTLRMKGNMMIVGTIPYPDEISINLAAKRGIIVTDHHFDLLGSNTFRFPSSISNEWLWQTTPSVPAFVWKTSMDALYDNTDGNVAFSVGYRGLNDYAGPCQGCTDQQKGMVISQVIANMTEWIDTQYGTSVDKLTYLWAEGITYFSAGYLTVPNGVSIILTDNGNGIIKDTAEYANVSEGIYTHTAMYNGHANQLTEMVSPFRHFSEIGKFATKSKKNKYAIINTSDLKPCILSTMAVFCYLYNGKKCENGDPRQYMLKWCERHYIFETETDMTDITTQIEQLYERYYNISYVQSGQSDNGIANKIYSVSNTYLEEIKANNGRMDQATVNALKQSMQSNATFMYIETLFTDALTLFEKISSNHYNFTHESRNLYINHILLQFAMHYFGQSVINNIYYSSLNLLNGNRQTAMDYLQTAMDSNMGQLFRYTRMSETGVWRGFYYGARLSDFQRARTMLRSLYQIMSTNDMNSCTLPLRPWMYYSFTWYQLPNSGNYPLFHCNATAHIETVPRIFCLNSGNEINNDNGPNCCINNANGGIFWMNNEQRKCGTEGAWVKINVIDWNVCKYIKYTIDGSVPNVDTKTYVINNDFMVNITKTTMVRASCQYFNDTMDAQITDAYFELQS